MYSVLMSVYYKEKPEFLIRSIDSTMGQTIAPSDFVLVCDGPLTEELDSAIETLQAKYRIINVVRLPENVGLGSALAEGLKHTKNGIVMRMDSDDVCLKYRAEIQLPFIKEYDFVGGWISEFDGEEDNIIGIRKVPEHFKDIYKFGKSRCPFNHPSVMFKKDTIEQCGGYQKKLFVEDYYLWVRLLNSTDRVYNIQQCLVNMRSGTQMRARRGGKIYKKSLKEIRKYMLQIGMINRFEYCWIVLKQTIFLSLPIKFKELLYKKTLRK